jgi:ring-1,2-phenylacetyl-CoA epoxidase subunit PaaD
VVRAREVAEAVTDPELPDLTLAELGVLRDVTVEPDGRVVVSLTPTYSGCPALGVMRADLEHRLRAAGFERVEVRAVLDPPWTTDWISESGRRKLAAGGIAPPRRLGAAHPGSRGAVALQLGPTRRAVACPRCGSGDTEEVSRFGATACKAIWRCRACREPFECVKEI